MLVCKNIVVVNGEKDQYTAVPYDRICLDFSSTDQTEKLTKNNKGKPVELNGKTWEGTKPSAKITAKTDMDAVTALVQEAMNHLVSTYGASDEFKDVPQETKGLLILLSAADYGNDLWVRAKIQADTRPAKAQDPAVALEKILKNIISEAAARGKTLTMEQAKARYQKMLELEAEEAAA